MTDPFVARLARSHRSLPDADAGLRALTAGRVRHYAPRTDILHEGDPLHGVRVVVSGWACRYKQLPDGRRQIVALLLPGDVCDHEATFDRMDHAVSALGTVALREIDPAAFAALSRADGPIGLELRRAAAVEAAIHREWLLNVGRRDAREGLAHLFCELWHRLDAVGLVEAGGYDLPLTQMDLADALGATAVHVNRMLRVLRKAGLVTLVKRRLTIPDLGALEKVALFDPTYLHLDEGAGPVASRP